MNHISKEDSMQKDINVTDSIMYVCVYDLYYYKR